MYCNKIKVCFSQTNMEMFEICSTKYNKSIEPNILLGLHFQIGHSSILFMSTFVPTQFLTYIIFGILGLFLLFFNRFITLHRKLPMTGSELRIFGAGSNFSPNCDTTSAQFFVSCLVKFFLAKLPMMVLIQTSIFYWRQCDQIKIAKCLKKLPQNDFTRKMIAFDTYPKIALECERFGQINCCQRL